MKNERLVCCEVLLLMVDTPHPKSAFILHHSFFVCLLTGFLSVAGRNAESAFAVFYTNRLDGGFEAIEAANKFAVVADDTTPDGCARRFAEQGGSRKSKQFFTHVYAAFFNQKSLKNFG
jgi:hypothetical protein